MVEPSTIFIDGTHIKASANKKKHVKEQVKKTAKIYAEQLHDEVNAERAELGKKPIDDDDEPGTKEGTVSVKTQKPQWLKGRKTTRAAFEWPKSTYKTNG